jgi:cyclase
MLKIRIIPVLLFKDRTIVKSYRFDELRMVGDPTTVARVFNERNADELLFLDIMASRRGEGPNFKVIGDIAEECFMPLTIGGGVRSLNDADHLFEIGADKVSLNTAAVKNPALITEIAKKYGSQAVVVSIDARKIGDRYEVFISGGTEKTGKTPIELAKTAAEKGAGEILITAIDEDGVTQGYDLELTRQVAEAVNIPVIASGGCGSLDDCVAAVREGKASAISAASIFHFVGESIITIKNYMDKQGLPVRIR